MGRWNVYGELKDQLRRRGGPEHIVKFMHDAKKDTGKWRLFAAPRSEQSAVLVGSTPENGCRNQLPGACRGAFVDMDTHWRLADVDHRHGRIVRHGNPHPDVRSTQVVAKESYDSFCLAMAGAPAALNQPDYKGVWLGYTPNQTSGRTGPHARLRLHAAFADAHRLGS